MSSPERTAWYSMIQRCENEKNPGYHRYGGRGIRVCKRWRSSLGAFLSDMGPRPSSDHSIDREKNDGHYSCGKCEECVANGWPANCRWATSEQQHGNKRGSFDEAIKGSSFELGHLRLRDPEAFRAKLREALIASDGSPSRAAALLNVDTRTLTRWIDKDSSLTEGIQSAARGWPKGKPRKPHVTPKING